MIGRTPVIVTATIGAYQSQYVGNVGNTSGTRNDIEVYNADQVPPERLSMTLALGCP